MTVLLVALGAAVGAPLRYLADRAVQARHDSVFPWGTLAVNVVGSFVLGTLAGGAVRGGFAALLGTGFCGALTTYSTFGYETLKLAESGARDYALRNAILSVTLGLLAAAGGYALLS
ncbi:fluoride efflux transporter CrcB [Catellatospora tritici]|uniref:fluoride efflux transporter CrcB n=1 Tax=Catellatospora tritici TaxID=2851566 RepID=UPI001C2CEF6A|nr:fluoride efflux transporter CrcB [Catellatospora tritici]MBV1852188.1 fluoride efflux transporter CrcB [Catellatospora tritici]